MNADSLDKLPREFDIAVIGGGLVGSALAWGLARAGQRVGRRIEPE